MGWKLRDYYCESCGSQFEELVDRDEDPSIQTCPECGKDAMAMMSAPNVASFSLKDKSAQIESLKKRSADHSKAMIKKDGLPRKYKPKMM